MTKASNETNSLCYPTEIRMQMGRGKPRAKSACFDFDPGDVLSGHRPLLRRPWEGGGEYNVARGLNRRCFGLKTAIVTALADNPIGRLLEDLMLARAASISRTSSPGPTLTTA